MPIKPENKSRYQMNWKDIVAAVRERSGNRCEGSPAYPACRAANGESHPVTGSKVILTTAHLGLPGFVPVNLRVTPSAQTDQIVELIGFCVIGKSERAEWPHMMHRRTLADFNRGPAAMTTSFVVALPRGDSCSPPTWPISERAIAVPPQLIVLTDWRLLRKPLQPALIRAEAATGTEIEPADAEWLAASFADATAESSFLDAAPFVATGYRADDFVVRSLLRSKAEFNATCCAVALSVTYARSGHNAILYHLDHTPENCDESNLRAWCQRCHLTYDAKHHAQSAYMTRKAKAHTIDLPL